MKSGLEVGSKKSTAYQGIFADVTSMQPNDWVYKTVEPLASA